VYAAAGRNYPPGDFRVSDADRDRVVAELGEHFQAGRLTADELDERTGLALRARTGSDLNALLADLPVSQAPWTGVTPVPGSSGPLPPASDARLTRACAPRTIPAIALAVVALIAVSSLLSGHPHQGIWIGPLLPILIVLLLVRRIAVGRGGRRRL
jgi:hypothetical protein